MRILAIRGENLASLAERFEIDFEKEPLRGAGLFAITGETGAGKSTILDALCLALYDAFPRVASQGVNEGIPDPSGHNVSAADPRSILRRGAGHGFAEVDFVGRDGARYRARCDLARARKKATGKMQQRGRALHRLEADGSLAAAVASGVEEVRAKVIELTDLTFDQFRRTVLLAQGDFDAFLRSDSKERADLLEKITGTSIYAEISRRVYQRNKEASEKVAELQRRREDVGLLAQEARLSLEAERSEIEASRARVLNERDAAVAVLRRHEAIAQAEARLAEAAARHVASLTALDALANARGRLRDLDKAQSLHEPLSRLQSCDKTATEAIDAESAKRVAGEQASATLERALAEEVEAAHALEAAETSFKAFGPEWSKAERLDSEIDVAAVEAQNAHEAARAAADAAQEKTQAEARFAEQAATMRAELEQARELLAQLADAAPLSDRWSEIAERISERARSAEKLAENAARTRELAEDIERLETTRGALDAADLRDNAERATIAAQLDQRRLALEALNEEDARRRRRVLETLERSMSHLSAEAKRHAKATTALERATHDLDETRRAEEAEVTTIAAARDRRKQDEARRAEVERMGELADAAASKEALSLRASLVAGAPCPVCGASDHPHAHAADAANVLIAELRARREALRADIAQAEQTIAAASARLAAAQARRADAQRRHGDSLGEIDQSARLYETLRADWPADAALARPPAIEEARAALDARAETITRGNAAIGETLERAQSLRDDIERLRHKYDRLGASVEARRKERDEATRRLSDARSEAAGLSASLDALRDRLRSIDASLTPFLSICDLTGADLDRHPDGAAQRLRRKGEDHREARLRVERLERELDALSQRLAAGAAEAQAAADAAAERKNAWSLRKQALDDLRDERAPLLGGESTAGHRTRANDARLTALSKRDAAASRRSEAASAKAGADRDLAHAIAARENAKAQRESAASDFKTALAAAGWDEATALALSNAPRDERASLRARIDDAERTLASAGAEREARARDLAEAVAAGRPEEGIGPLEERRVQAEATMKRLDQRAGEIAAQIGADDTARRKAASLAADIEAAEATAKTWAEVDAAIGSASGDKFRRFAQSVTLDHLVALANRHLSALTPRYRLERSPSEAADLGLQIVDRDLCDERRSTRSLSGGERFLASLALALGLCSLEGRGSFVDTLFIDEGFGSLDATTLDVAIDALESLQGQGRKVGLISHVESLHQRIPVQIRVEKRGGGKSVVRIDARAIGVG